VKPNDFFEFYQGEKPSIVQKHAILIHQAKALSDTNAQYRASDFLASMHDFVTNEQGESVIGAGRLMSKEDVESVLRSMLEMGKRKISLLQPNVVSISETPYRLDGSSPGSPHAVQYHRATDEKD
jgi:hypothetical protein